MASTYAHLYRDAQGVLDDIDCQFRLEADTLTDIVKVFLDEFRAGLSNYGHPMAMMCVYWLSTASSFDFCRPTFVTGVPNGTETG